MDNPTVLYRKSTKTLVNGVDIGKGVKYTAVSHTWSMWDNVSKDILHIEQDIGCEGTANFDAMVDFVNTEWVWIDTLCISESTKVTEIPNMRRYYKNAEVVLVVLDTSKGDYNLSALKVEDLGRRLDSGKRMRLHLTCAERATGESLQSEGVTIYNTLCQMSKAAWFKRGWTLQELLLAKDVIIWNGSTSVSGTDVRKCVEWLGTVTPDVMNGLEFDDDYSALLNIFHEENNKIWFESPFESVDQLMEGRRCTKDEDYVYCILGLLDVDIKIEYGIPLHVCKRSLFSRLVQDQRAASLFTHMDNGLFPIHNEYGTSFNPDNPRSDRVVYSLSGEGVKFAGCDVYVYQSLGTFPTNSFNKSDPVRNLWEITRMLGDDLSRYKDLVRAMYCFAVPDEDEFITTKAEWFVEMARALAPTASAELADVSVNGDCTLLHLLLNQPQTPQVSYGMVHNNTSVCAYIFTCLEAVPEDGKCLLLAPGIIGEVRETGILCAGLNPDRRKQRKIGATLNLKRTDCLETIEPVANLPEVIVTNNKFRRHSVANVPEVRMGDVQDERHSI